MIAEAVLLAFFEFATALLRVIEKAMDGQSADQRATMWAWYIKDIERVRRLLKLDDPAGTAESTES